jgi:hypothetical protein
VADRIAERSLPAMAHMQGAGRVGRDKFDQHLLASLSSVAVAGAGLEHLAHHLLAGSRLQPEVDEARPCDLDGLHPLLIDGLGHEIGLQGLGQLPGIELERLGQLHGGIAGQIAVRGRFWRLEGSAGTRARNALFEFSGQAREQFLFDSNHARILSGGVQASDPQMCPTQALRRQKSGCA